MDYTDDLRKCYECGEHSGNGIIIGYESNIISDENVPKRMICFKCIEKASDILRILNMVPEGKKEKEEGND